MSPLRLGSAPSPSHAQPGQPSSLLANLAASPFVNRRPVQRFAVAAWVVGALLTGVNVLLWVQYRHESTALRGRLADTRAAIERTSKRVVDMDAQLGGLRLPAQNAQVAFLNGRIAERTFPWSLLFERIATTLPDGVRLMSLSPVFDDREDTKARSKKKKEEGPPPALEDQMISLKIRGAAKTDDSLYQLIDAFFASPAFARPRLYSESSSGTEVEFSVDVDYKPRYTGDPSHQSAGSLEADADDESGDRETSDEESTDEKTTTRATPPRVVEVPE